MLVECPKCQGSVSDEARQCVHCGCLLDGAEGIHQSQDCAPEGPSASGADVEELSDDSKEPSGTMSQGRSFKLVMEGLGEKVKKSSRVFKGAVAGLAVVLIALAVYVATEPPFVGKWYQVDSPESFIELKRDGSVIYSDGMQRTDADQRYDASWSELEKNVVVVDFRRFEKSGVERESIVAQYGKTSDGIEYLEANGFLACKRYEDAVRMSSKG